MAEPGLRPFSLDNPPLEGLRRNDVRRRARRAASAPGAWIHLLVIGFAGVTAIGAFFGIGFALLTQTTTPLDTGSADPAPPAATASRNAPAALPAAPAPLPAKPPTDRHRAQDDYLVQMAAAPSDAQPAPDQTASPASAPKPTAPAAPDPVSPPPAKEASPSTAAAPVPSPPPLPPISAAEAARFVHYGEGFLRHAELPAARLFFAAASAAGDGQGALRMGETFDPAAHSRAVRGQADPALARSWYQRAADLGSIEAELRLDHLDRPPAR